MSRKKREIGNADVKQIVETNRGIIDALKKLSMALHEDKAENQVVSDPKQLKSI